MSLIMKLKPKLILRLDLYYETFAMCTFAFLTVMPNYIYTDIRFILRELCWYRYYIHILCLSIDNIS